MLTRSKVKKKSNLKVIPFPANHILFGFNSNKESFGRLSPGNKQELFWEAGYVTSFTAVV